MASHRGRSLLGPASANQSAYADGWLQPDQFAYNMALLSAELDEIDTAEAAASA